MRIRSIHPDALKSKKLRDASPEAERCYWRLQVACDDAGRCEDDIDVLADQLFLGWRTVEPEDVDGWLWELHELGLVMRYSISGEDVIEVVQWSKYQHPQHPKPSTLPEFRSGTERSHEASPDHGEENREELSRDGEGDGSTFMNSLTLAALEGGHQEREKSGSGWRARCQDEIHAARRSARSAS